MPQQIEIVRLGPYRHEMCDITYMSTPSDDPNMSQYLIVVDKNGHEFLARQAMGCWRELRPMELYEQLRAYQNERAITRTPGGAFSYHEVVDRLYTVQLMFDELISEHTIVNTCGDLQAQASHISECLAKMYNTAARKPYHKKEEEI